MSDLWKSIALILLSFVDPIWIIMDSSNKYSHLFGFYLTHAAFWHSLTIPCVLFPIIFLPENLNMAVVLYCNTAVTYITLWAIVFDLNNFMKKYKPRIQKLDDMICGLFGMIGSVWAMIGCLIVYEVGVFQVAPGLLFIASQLCLGFSYLWFSNFTTKLYIQLFAKDKPFFKVKKYVVYFAMAHLTVFLSTLWATRIWPVFLLLLTCSFVFCVDAWSCCFADSYMLCEHREHEDDTKRDGNVIFRAVPDEPGKLKSLKSLFKLYQKF